jgi:hypothetical protein
MKVGAIARQAIQQVATMVSDPEGLTPELAGQAFGLIAQERPSAFMASATAGRAATRAK